MNKRQLIEIIAQKTHLTKKFITEVMKSFLDETTRGLIKGKKIVLSGFGTFKVVKVKAKKGRVIKTGQEVNIPAHRAVKFTVSKTLKKAVK